MADALTKYLDQATLFKHMASMNIKEEKGRATSAPKIAADPDEGEASKQTTSQ